MTLLETEDLADALFELRALFEDTEDTPIELVSLIELVELLKLEDVEAGLVDSLLEIDRDRWELKAEDCVSPLPPQDASIKHKAVAPINKRCIFC